MQSKLRLSIMLALTLFISGYAGLAVKRGLVLFYMGSDAGAIRLLSSSNLKQVLQHA